ncbi:MAG TPA: hypothetical protein VFJ19_17315 [Nocardioidaceae bacterium]|nr:hypothetical protein [Nocardioidaceae bacterium]
MTGLAATVTTPMPVVYASIVVDWVAAGSDRQGPARRLLDDLAAAGSRVVGPRLLREEVANALLTGLRHGLVALAERLGEQLVTADDGPPRRVALLGFVVGVDGE